MLVSFMLLADRIGINIAEILPLKIRIQRLTDTQLFLESFCLV